MAEESDDVVLDVEMLATLFGGLNEEPDLFHALQFVTLAEAAVLRDNLIVVSIEEGYPEYEAERAKDRALVEEFMAPMISAGAARIEQIAVEPSAKLPDHLSEGDAGTVHTVAAEEDEIANLAIMAGRSLTVERVQSTPALTLPMQQTFYEMSANVRGDHSVCDLTGHYKSLAKAVDALRGQEGLQKVGYDFVPIPPIGLEVFRSASSVETLPEAILKVRERYADLRSRLRDLEEMSADSDVPLNEKLKQRQKWARAWESLHTKYEFAGEISLADTNTAIYRLAPSVPGAMALDPSAWMTLLVEAVERWPELWARWRMRALHRTLASYVKSPDRDLGAAVENIIGRPVTDEEVRDVRDVQALMAQFVESAVVIYAADASEGSLG